MVRRTRKARSSKTIGLDHALLGCFLQSFNIRINGPHMRLGFNIFGEAGFRELGALFYIYSENGFPPPLHT